MGVGGGVCGGGVAPFTVAVLACEMKASYNYSLRAASGFQLPLLSFLKKKIKEYGN